MALTAKQAKFANLVASGMSQFDAYQAAYDAKAMKPATIRKNASVLMHRKDIASIVVAAQREAGQQAVLGAAELDAKVISILLDARDPRRGWTDHLKAADMLYRRWGLYQEDRPNDAAIEAELARLAEIGALDGLDISVVRQEMRAELRVSKR